MPNTPFEYEFQDETLASLYVRELRLQKASYAATFLAMLIALLGIFGLVAISIQKRTKEIGIRKVIGARPKDVITLFVRDFLPVVMIAALLACPISWWMMQNWLADYAYRIELSLLPFAITLLLLTGITILLIGWQCFRASQLNPVEAIKE